MPRDRCLLLVDDEEDLCNIYTEHYRQHGWGVYPAFDGKTALEHFRENIREITVVVSDLKMPGVQGEQLLREIRLLNQDIPLIAITGEPDRKKHLRALETGAYFYLEKPIHLDALDRYLENAHHIYELTLDLAERASGDSRVARLFRDFVVSERPQRIWVSNRVRFGGIGLEIASHTFPSDKPGGDYVEWFSRGSEELLFAVGDASGHGEFLCTLMACLTSIVLHRSHHLGRLSIEEIASIIDSTFLELKQRDAVADSKYMCLFLGGVSLLTGKLTYLNAGHTDAFVLLGSAGEEPVPIVDRLPRESAALGTHPRFRNGRALSESTRQLRPGDYLLIYTDGASEFLAEKPSEGMARLAEAFAACRRSTAEKTLQNLVEWLKNEAGGGEFADDATLLLIRILDPVEALEANERKART